MAETKEQLVAVTLDIQDGVLANKESIQANAETIAQLESDSFDEEDVRRTVNNLVSAGTDNVRTMECVICTVSSVFYAVISNLLTHTNPIYIYFNMLYYIMYYTMHKKDLATKLNSMNSLLQEMASQIHLDSICGLVKHIQQHKNNYDVTLLMLTCASIC